MRVESFLRRPPIGARGRFGFTEWQHKHEPVRGWITPGLAVAQLDLIPEEPWASLAAEYVELRVGAALVAVLVEASLVVVDRRAVGRVKLVASRHLPQRARPLSRAVHRAPAGVRRRDRGRR